MKLKKINKADPPGLTEKISYGIGDFANNGMFTFVSTYLMYYCTDQARLNMTFVSVILMLGSVVNAAFSPVMGILIDKVNGKFGKCRPFMAIGMLPACSLLILLFSIKGNSRVNSIVILLVYIAFNMAYAMENVPYTTLLTVITDDQKERISLNLFKNIGSNAGGIFVTAATLPLVSLFSGAGRNGYHDTALFFGILFFIGMFLCVIHTEERVGQTASAEKRKMPFSRVIKEDGPWRILCVVQFLTMMMIIVRYSGSIYYAKYYLGNQFVSSAILTINSVICLLMAMVLPFMERRLGLKKLVVFGDGLYCIAMIGTALAGKSVMMILFFHCLSSVGFAMATGMIFVILSQTIDYAEWKTGVRPQELLTSLLAFAQKIGIGLAGLLSAQILKAGGYSADTALTASAVFSIKMLFWGLPLALSILIVIAMLFYQLDSSYPQMMQELQARRMQRKQTEINAQSDFSIK